MVKCIMSTKKSAQIFCRWSFNDKYSVFSRVPHGAVIWPGLDWGLSSPCSLTLWPVGVLLAVVFLHSIIHHSGHDLTFAQIVCMRKGCVLYICLCL